MIFSVKKENISEVFEYIGEDYCKCIYLYLDLKQYGVDNDFVKAWIQKKGTEIVAVLLCYYSGMHIYSKDNRIIKEEIKEIIKEEKPTIICGESSLLEKLELKENYIYEKGFVRYLDKICFEDETNVTKADAEDFEQIGKMLYEDEDIGCSYKLDELITQLKSRNHEGFTRNYVIKNDGKVISHAATGAENDKLAMLAYVITDKDSRGKGYAQKVCSKICKDLIEEGKKVCLINYSNESTKLYDKIGFKVYCDWSKLYIDLKKKQ